MPATLTPVAPTSVAPKPMSPPDEPPPKASAERRKGDETTAKISAERRKALEAALSQIERQFGQGSIMRLGEGAGNQKLDAIPTGSIALDIALGIGGVPRGRIVEIYGPESAGKSTLAQHIIAEAQKAGGTAAYIDVEHALDPAYAVKTGINLDDLLVSQPDAGEQALEITDALIRSGAVDLIVVDSVAALVTRAEIEGEMGDAHVGLQARLMSQALRKLTASISRTKCVVIFINQLREKIGIMYGNPEVTPGGRALKFYSSVRMEIRRVESIKQGTEIVGNRVKVKIVKNKVAPPFKVAEFDIMFDEGISRMGDLLDLGATTEIVKKSGSFYSYGETRLGQGRENSKQFLQENPDLAEALEREIRAELEPKPKPKPKPKPDAPTEPKPEDDRATLLDDDGLGET